MIKRSLFVSASAFVALAFLAPITDGLDLATISEEEASSEAITGDGAIAKSLMVLAQSECQTGRRSECEKKLDDIKKECCQGGSSKRSKKRRRRR